MKLPKDLRAFVESLNAANAKYVIVGGYAVAFYGHPRFTGDIDFFVESTPENADRIVRAIDLFGFTSLGLTRDDFVNPDIVVQIGFPPNRVDLITGIEAVSFEEAWSSRQSVQLDGLPVAFISKELLIRNKTAAGRQQDRGDISRLKE
jgi:predicted nucleotidyltransferase